MKRRGFSLLLLLSALVLTANLSFAQEKRTRTLSSGSASSLADSVESGTATPEAIPLTLIDAIHRGLKTNLAVISGDIDARIAEAERQRDLSDLLPKINGQMYSMSQQVNLAAYGFTGFAGISQVIGPFSLVDARASLSQSIVDMQRIHNLRESRENLKAVALSNQSTREIVVLTVMELYFRTVSAASRVLAVEAQVVSAEALNKRAADLKSAGVVPGIDVLRAQVELQSVQQRLIQARNDLSREKLNLARAIGLPLAQEFTIADSLPGGASPEVSLQELFERAYANRSEVKASEARLRAAEEAVKAARAESLPTVHFDANYGVIGPRPNDSHGTFAVAGGVQFPIFNSRSKSDTMEKEALLHQRQAQIDSLHGRVELEVREAFLELQSTEQQYKVAQSALALVREQLTQAQDRFAAGVANNLEVVQAQEALALADENVIRSLYGFNAARAALAHATGVTEKSVEEVFGRDKRP